jgi:glucose/arabinose dehydrogenase
MVWGPDGMIWVTERGGSILRVHPRTGAISRVATIPGVVEINVSGLMGMTFHPQWAKHPYVYLVYTDSAPRIGMRNRLVRMRYSGGALGPQEVLIDNIPGGAMHNGSRLAIGPDGFLYMTMGDNDVPDLAQDTTSLNGKVLRLTLDGRPAPGNPFHNAIYSYGHRNPQGLAFNPKTRQLYVSEHGPADNDEVNLIRRGGNYGWPNVHGFCDNDIGPDERAFCRAHHVVEPLMAWTPTAAVDGMAIYLSDRIPGWKNSLLLTTLKDETLFRLTLSRDGTRIVGRDALYKGAYGRLRHVLVGPQGEVYLATNTSGSGPVEGSPDRILRVVPKRDTR